MTSERTLICLDGLNWLNEFWNLNADVEFMSDPWEALRNADKTVGEFVRAALASNYDLVLVTDADTKTAQASEKWQTRREQEIVSEKRRVCLGADIFLVESFRKHGVRVVMPIGADADDVLAALAVANSGVVLSRDRDFFYYNVPIRVSTGFTVYKGTKLLVLEPPTTTDYSRYPRQISRQIQPQLANVAGDGNWSLGVNSKYRPSVKNGLITRGTSSSSDKIMGSLHVLARPLRAAVYAILGEPMAQEKIPQWSQKEKKVVFTETMVAADPSLMEILDSPVAVAAWLVERDTPVLQLAPWRARERIFNTCAIASEMCVAVSEGAKTMHGCMDMLSKELPTIKSRCKYSHDL